MINDNTRPERSNDRHLYYTLSIILIWSGLTYLLSSCNREEDVSGNDNTVFVPATGEPVTVNFTAVRRDFGHNDVAVRSTAQTQPPPTPPKEGSYPPLSGELEGASLYLSASLQEKSPAVRLRAAQLEPNRKVRVAAYDITAIPNDTVLLTYADYKVDAGYNLVPFGMPPLTVPSGNTLFVAWSFNDTITMDAFSDVIPAIGSRDLLWGDTTVTVGTGNKNVHILLDHLFSKIEVEAESVIPSGDIHVIYGARYDHTFPALTVRSGNLTPDAPDTIHVVWQAAGSATIWPSVEHFVYTNGLPPVLTIDSVWINGTIYKNTPPPWTVTSATPLAAGSEYMLKVRFVPPSLSVSTNSLPFAKCLSGSGVQQVVTVATNLPAGWDYSMSGAHAGDFTVVRSGDMLTVYPNANTCCAPRTATLTVTAGDHILTETIAVTQAPKSWRYDYNGSYHTFTPPCSGIYQIELWGAGSRYTVGGGYVKGDLNVGSGQALSLYIGGQGLSGQPSGSIIPGGYNGGGNAFNYSGDTNSGSGGGATDIRFGGTGLINRIMVAGGAGGFVGAEDHKYGTGGGLSGSDCSILYKAITYTAYGGTQSAGGISSGSNAINGSFGQGGNGGTASVNAGHNISLDTSHRAGGGGGYYGGGHNVLAGGGGSSFISGHPGCNAVNSSGSHTNQPNHFSNLIFTNTLMTAGNLSMPNPNGGTMTGNVGHGVVVITYKGP